MATRPAKTRVLLKTLKVRVRDRHILVLVHMAREVNILWNFCNALSQQIFRDEDRFLSAFEFDEYTTGLSRKFRGIGSSTIQETSHQYAAKRRAAEKVLLRWRRSESKRGRPRSLGWIPFKARAAKWKEGAVCFAGRRFQVRDSYGLENYTFRAGAFVEDARGRWYFTVQVAVEPESGHAGPVIGIDLGLKDVAVTSDGQRLEHARCYRRTQGAIGLAQRARKKARVRALYAKVKNQRRDGLQKWSRALVNRASEIVVGNVSPSAVGKTKMAKSVYDSGWTLLRGMLKYKSEHAGIPYVIVSERNSTRTCSCCGTIPASSPKGRTGLRIREWICCDCGARHDRDVNAARNILELGHQLLAGGIPVL